MKSTYWKDKQDANNGKIVKKLNSIAKSMVLPDSIRLDLDREHLLMLKVMRAQIIEMTVAYPVKESS